MPPLLSYTHSAARLTFREQAYAWLRAVCYTLVYPSIEPLHETDNTNRGPSQHSWPVGSCISGGVFLRLHRNESSGQQACVAMLTGQFHQSAGQHTPCPHCWCWHQVRPTRPSPQGLPPTCLSAMLPRLNTMQPRTSDTGSMNMGNTTATAILQVASRGHKNRGHPTWPNATEGSTGRQPKGGWYAMLLRRCFNSRPTVCRAAEQERLASMRYRAPQPVEQAQDWGWHACTSTAEPCPRS